MRKISVLTAAVLSGISFLLHDMYLFAVVMSLMVPFVYASYSL